VKTVPGRTDRVVIVGAGLAGLSAALRLAGAGRQVTVLEREDVPGGRNGLLELPSPAGDGTYRFDTGPTVLTMPDLIADALDCVGEELDDWLELEPVDPLYRRYYPDGSTLDVKADVGAMADEVERVCGPTEAQGYLRYVDFVSQLYRYEMKDFIDRNIDNPFDLLTPNLARLAAVGGFRRLAPKVEQYLKDPRTQRVLSFQSMYAGLSPYDALAIYAVIAYMDSVAGVYFPKGGMHAVPRALAGAAEKHGVDLRYGTSVSRVLVEHGRAVGVETATASASPPTSSSSTPTCPSPTASCCRRRRRRAA
jgi:phytoene desaturase